MIKKLTLAIIILCVGIMAAQAAEVVTLQWDASDKADGYKIYWSLDQGTTWVLVVDVGNVLTWDVGGVPSSGLVLFRVSAYNTSEESIMYWSGAWFNGDWVPPTAPKGARLNN